MDMTTRSRPLQLFLVVGIGLVVMVAIGVFFMVRPQWPHQSLVDAQRTATFALFYPASLPSGFSYVEKSLTTADDGVVIYKLRYEDSKYVAISAQKKPAGVDFDDFYNRVLTNKADVVSTYGKAVVGQIDGKPLGSLVTDNVWVLVNCPSGIDGTTLSQLMTSLKPL
jgi:hypothetical protein